MERTVTPQQQLITASVDPVPARRVDDVPVAEEMSDSFLAYAMSVITARAIPDVRDGLKPVQRRVLWSMLQMGVRPGTPYRKSARIVGDTMGRYHPHGDAAIYDTLVRMGQDFSRMVPLVDPQGNFGSLDDPPAAARYTECRLSAAAMDMVSELDEDTVDFRATYDGEGSEPVVLPAALPNLLVNGTAGIAVGMATNMAPHNLAEVAAAIEMVMRHQRSSDDDDSAGARRSASNKPSTEDLLSVLAGPDYPGGGVVLVDDGLRQAYETGRGVIRARARLRVEQVTQRRDAVIVEELPHLVGPERVVSRITELVASGRLAGVAGVADLSDMDGLRLQVHLKPNADADTVLRALYQHTPLEESQSVNNVVLVDGVPTTLGLRALCEQYIAHRLEVIVRRTRHRLAQAEARLHIVEGLLTALDNIDEIVALIRASQDAAAARAAMMQRFELSEIQASSILEMPLRRLTALERQKLLEEAESLRASIADYREILASDRRRRAILRAELRRIVDEHGRERRSELVPAEVADKPVAGGAERVAAESSVVSRDVPCVVTLSTSGKIGRSPLKADKRATPGLHDLIAARVVSSTAARVAAVTTMGRVLLLRVADLAESSGRGRGDKVSALVDLSRGERVLTLLASGEDRLVLITSEGMVKRLDAEVVFAAAPGAAVLPLESGESVAAAFAAPDGADIVIVADDARAIRFASSSVRLASLKARTTKGMNLRDGAAVAGAGAVIGDAADVVVATRSGGVKATECSELAAQNRDGQGIFIAKLADGDVVVAAVVAPRLGLLALMGLDDDAKRIDRHPVPVEVEPTARYRAPQRSERRIHVMAPGRW